MSVDRGLLALLEAKPGKGDELAACLQQGRELAVAEEGTVTWYAFKISDTTYGIFDTFEGEDGWPGGRPERGPPRPGRGSSAVGSPAPGHAAGPSG